MNHKRLSIVTAILCIGVILIANISEIKTYAEESTVSTSPASQETKEKITETTSTQHAEEPSAPAAKDTASTQTITTTETVTETMSIETVSTETATEKSNHKNVCTLQYKAEEGGTVSSSEETVTSSDDIKGSTAAPDNDHTFDGWYKDDELITKELTLIPTVDFTVQSENTSTVTETTSTTTETQETAGTSVTQVYTAKFTEIAPVILEKEIDGHKITVKGIHIPEGAELSVVSVSNKDAEKTVNELNNSKETFTADVSYDIGILIDGEVWQPADHDTTVTVSITNIDEDKITENDKELKVYRIADDKKEITDIDTTVKEDVANFDTDHFTVYTIGGVEYDIGENSVVLLTGKEFNATIKQAAGDTSVYNYATDNNIKSIVVSYDNPTTGTVVSASDSPKKAYVTYTDNIITIHVPVDAKIYMNTNSGNMFNNCSSLTSLDLSKFDTSKVTDMNSMFYGCSSLTSLDLSKFDTNNVTYMSSMFYGCSSLTSLDLSKFDTNNVTYMSSMFYGCSSLTSLDLIKFDTSNVTGMDSMFSRCTSLTSLDVSKFDTSNVTGMDSMFSRCTSLTSLDVSSFYTSDVTNMSSMFNYCSSLTLLNLSKFDTSKVTDMTGMFFHCSSLTSLYLSKFDTSKVTDMESMFTNCSSLTSLDLSNFDTSKVTNMKFMFYHCSSLTSLDVSKFDTSKVTDMEDMFYYCSSLTSLDLSSFYTSDVTNMSSMFNYCSSLTLLNLSNFDTGKVTNMEFMFYRCSSLNQISLGSKFKFVGTNHKFSTPTLPATTAYSGNWVKTSNTSQTDAVATADFPTAFNADPTTMADTWYAQLQPEVIPYEYDINGTNIELYNYIGKAAAVINVPAKMAIDGKEYNVILKHNKAAKIKHVNDSTTETNYGGCSIWKSIYYYIKTINIENGVKVDSNGSALFAGLSSLSSCNFDVLDVSNVIDMSRMFENCGSLCEINIDNWDTSKVVNMYDMFGGCLELADFDLSILDTSKVTNMSYIFRDCTSFPATFDISKVNTSNVTDMSGMFYECSSLEHVIINGIDTSQVTSMYNMFGYCKKLSTLDIDKINTSSLETTNYMFHNDKLLANIDLSKWNTINLSNTRDMFSCEEYMSFPCNYPDDVTSFTALKSIDLSGWDTQNLKDASDMFSFNTGLTSVNLSGWNTCALTNCKQMFNDDISLTNINLTGWDTSNVTDMDLMFGYCQTLKELDIKDFNTKKYSPSQSYFNPFEGCDNLIKITVGKDFDEALPDHTNSCYYHATKHTLYYSYTTDWVKNSSANHLDSGEPVYSETLKNQTDKISGTWYAERMPNMVVFDYDFRIHCAKAANGSDNIRQVVIADDIKEEDIIEQAWDENAVIDNGIFNGEKVSSIYLCPTSHTASGSLYTEGLCSQQAYATYSNGTLTIHTPKNAKIYLTVCYEMFDGWKNLESIDMSKFDSTYASGVEFMFQNCSSLSNIVLPTHLINTNCTNLYSMFNGCSSLESLDLNDWDTENVTGINMLFNGCTSLKLLSLSNWNTSKVTHMDQVFSECSSLKSLDLSNWNTSKVTNMYQIFSGCSSLESLNISNFDSSITTDDQEHEMFKGCDSLSQITLGPKFKFLGQDVYDKTGALVSSNTCFFTPTIPENTFTGNWVRTSCSTHTGQITSKDFKDTFNTNPVTMAGTWYAEKNYLTVTYGKNGADSGTVPAASLPDVGATMTVANNTGNLTKAGYTFAGWNTKTDGSGDNYQSGNAFAPTSNTTLYVEWSKDIVVSSVNNNSDASTSSNGTSTKSKKLANNIPQSESNTNNENSTLGTKTSPFTGDNAEILLYVIIMIISASIMIRLYVVKKKKSHISV
jgi:surface protein